MAQTQLEQLGIEKGYAAVRVIRLHEHRPASAKVERQAAVSSPHILCIQLIVLIPRLRSMQVTGFAETINRAVQKHAGDSVSGRPSSLTPRISLACAAVSSRVGTGAAWPPECRCFVKAAI